jgi:large subunit ribosomal protein L18
VFRSNRHIYAQIIDDTTGKTLASASTTGAGFGSGDEKKVGNAMKVGEAIGKVAIEKGIKKVVFDRSGHIYHGRIKALADGARKSGLAF